MSVSDNRQAELRLLEIFKPHTRGRRIVFWLIKHLESVDDPCKTGQVVLHLGRLDTVSVSDQRPEEVTYDA